MMNVTRVTAFVLYVDGQQRLAADSLQQAMDAAEEFIPSGLPLRIEHFTAPAPTKLWHYDHSTTRWG
jgi:hypothetical protein